jgi:hypothetical protein
MEFAFIGGYDLVNDADEGGFSGAIGAKQPENMAFRDVDAHLVERFVILKLF